jgi:hypothetical protein
LAKSRQGGVPTVRRRRLSPRARRVRRDRAGAPPDAISPVELRHASGGAHRRRRRRGPAPVVVTPYAYQLVFSIRRARKRRRRRRVAAALGLLSVVTIALRIPGSDAGLRLIEDFVEDNAAAAEGPESTESTASVLRFRRSVFRSRADQRTTSEVTSGGAATTDIEASAEPAAAPASITEIVYSAAAEFGISGDYLLSVASCESSLDPWAYNAAGYQGLFQFDQQTWAAYGYGWIYDAVAQARTAARLLAAGHSFRWPNCA